MTWTLDSIVARVLELEESYFDLQDRYQLLIHQYEQLKELYESSSRHRNEPESQQDLGSNDH